MALSLDSLRVGQSGRIASLAGDDHLTQRLMEMGLFEGEPLISFNSPDGNIDWTTVFIFAAVLALLNTFVRPILAFLSAPITCLTLGLFVIVINMAMFWLADWLVPNIEVAGWLGGTANDLEEPAIGLAPEIGDVLDILSDEPESLIARMSGSGATCFALCSGDLEAEGLAERIEAMRPDRWVRRCRLGGPWDIDDVR